MNGNHQANSSHLTALTALKRDRLCEMLADDERHLAVLGKTIEKQERFIEELDNSRRGDSITIESARGLLATMKRARAGYIADCDRIRRALEGLSQAPRGIATPGVA